MAFDTLTAEIAKPNAAVDGVQLALFPDLFATAAPLGAAEAASDPDRALARLFAFPETGPALEAVLGA